jgi:hypothetical protein
VFRTASIACPAPAESTDLGSRCGVLGVGATGRSGPSGPVSRRSSRPTSRGSSTSSPSARGARPASETGTSTWLSTSQRTGSAIVALVFSAPIGGPAARRSSTARAAGGAASTVRRSFALSAHRAAVCGSR